MGIYNTIKLTMDNHKSKIQLIQWSIMAGVSSLIYSQYIRQIKQKQVPTRRILVPSIKSVCNFLDYNGTFIRTLSSDMIDNIVSENIFCRFSDAKELILFNSDNIDTLKAIVDLYILPNISKYIPELLIKKFQLGNSNNQLIIESNDIDIFNGNEISENLYKFIYHQVLINILVSIPTMKKELSLPEDNVNILMDSDEILTVDSDSAICKINFDKLTIENDEIMNLLSFVTNTTFEKTKCGFKITSSPFNQLSIIKLIELSYS